VSEKTIYSLTTPLGRSGVAVVRVSGKNAKASLLDLCGALDFKPEPRCTYLKKIKNPVDKSVIDHALVVFFKGPESFTGEDVVEYHIHGGPAIIRELLDALSNQDNHRLAEPGQFTRRAFENGKIDLTGAEAIADLINAETILQKNLALNQLEGSLSELYEGWTNRLIEILAHLEADLEFPDEDIEEEIPKDLLKKIEKLITDINEHLSDNKIGERLRDGIRVSVVGAPNVGKSSLVNLLSKRDVSIVSEYEGTTRDVIDVHLDIGGFPVILSDTAGLRAEQLKNIGEEKIEFEGIRRAYERSKSADIRLVLFDYNDLPELNKNSLELINDQTLVVFNKCEANDKKIPAFEDQKPVVISVKENIAVDALTDALLEKIENQFGLREAPSLTRQRHREALEESKACLERVSPENLPELVVEDVRLAIRSLGKVTGKVDVEDILDKIFGDFCIGK
jgi:tRNA modification GTPase